MTTDRQDKPFIERRKPLNEDTLKSFTKVYFGLLKRNDFFEKASVKQVPLGTNFLEDYKKGIAAAKARMPKDYREAFFEPLNERYNLKKIILMMTTPGKMTTSDKPWLTEWPLRAILNCATQPADDRRLGDDLRGLWAVASDIYRSFIEKWKQIEYASVPKNTLPPLVAFTFYNLKFSDKVSMPAAPVTFDLGYMKRLSKLAEIPQPLKVGVVSLPSGFRKHPIFWGILSHEVGGHDVLNAETTLLPQLRDQIRKKVRAKSEELLPNDGRALEVIWDNWAEEAASDVCAVLNLGPFYGLGVLIYYTTMYHLWLYPKDHNEINEGHHGPILENKVVTIYDGKKKLWSDRTHPVPILIPHIILGALDALTGLLAEPNQTRYRNQMQYLAKQCEGDKRTIDLSSLDIKDSDGKPIDLTKQLPLKAMQQIAYEVGKCIATAPLPALGGKSLLALEKWDDADEKASQLVAENLQKGQSVDGIKTEDGQDIDNARLIAGAIFAVLREPFEKYAHINDLLREALVHSYEKDPLVTAR